MFRGKVEKLIGASFLIAALISLNAKEFNLQTASVEDINDAFEAKALTAEKLVKLCIARIEAYDQKGPKLNSVIAINPNALEIARKLDEERNILSNFSYRRNLAILHTDENIMPKNKDVWSSWNSFVDKKNTSKNSLSYWLNLLQNLKNEKKCKIISYFKFN